VDVNHAPRKALNEFGAQDPHVTGKNHQRGLESFNSVSQCNVKGDAIFVSFYIQRMRRNIGALIRPCWQASIRACKLLPSPDTRTTILFISLPVVFSE